MNNSLPWASSALNGKFSLKVYNQSNDSWSDLPIYFPQTPLNVSIQNVLYFQYHLSLSFLLTEHMAAASILDLRKSN